MITSCVGSGIQLTFEGIEPAKNGRALFKPDFYSEFMGGLGDVVLRMHETGCYSVLEDAVPGKSAVVVLMSHNPYVRDLFEWHRNRDRINVYDLGFTTPFHPWENREWRIEHGLPPTSPSIYPLSDRPIRYYPSRDDFQFVESVRKNQYVVVSVSAGNEERTIPEAIRESVADWIIGSGFRLVVVGRSEYRCNRNLDVRNRLNVIDALDLLSVPGTAELIRHAAGVISSHTSIFHIAIEAKKPTMLLYPKIVKERYVGFGPVGYMKGIDRPKNDHMEFSEYTVERMAKWIQGLLK